MRKTEDWVRWCHFQAIQFIGIFAITMAHPTVLTSSPATVPRRALGGSRKLLLLLILVVATAYASQDANRAAVPAPRRARSLQDQDSPTAAPQPSASVTPTQTWYPTQSWYPTQTYRPTVSWSPTQTYRPTVSWSPTVTARPTEGSAPSPAGGGSTTPKPAPAPTSAGSKTTIGLTVLMAVVAAAGAWGLL